MGWPFSAGVRCLDCGHEDATAIHVNEKGGGVHLACKMCRSTKVEFVSEAVDSVQKTGPGAAPKLNW